MQNTFDVVVLSYGSQGHVVTAFAGEGQFNVVAAQIKTRKFGTFKPHRFWICHDLSIHGVEIRVGVKFDPAWTYADYRDIKQSILNRFYQGIVSTYSKDHRDSIIGDSRFNWDAVPFKLCRSKAAKVLTKTFPEFLQVMSLGNPTLVLCTRISPEYKPTESDPGKDLSDIIEAGLKAKAMSRLSDI